jgi:hypothetical protein
MNQTPIINTLMDLFYRASIIRWLDEAGLSPSTKIFLFFLYDSVLPFIGFLIISVVIMFLAYKAMKKCSEY